MPRLQFPKRADLTQVGRGFLMGAADIIPGVSGGTVALVLGIYRRLVGAISHFDLTFVGLLRNRQWGAAATHVDLRLLVPLGCGVLLGFGCLAKLMNFLLEQHFAATSSVFFGLILASTVLVARMVQRWSLPAVVGVVAGAVLAYAIVGILPDEPPSHWWYTLLCGMVGICAMILPGISGAFIILVMGKYGDITEAVRDLLELKASSDQLLMLVVFAMGCVLGLLGFSKILRWLLTHYESPTMAVLCGFLIGSLRKIWPLKRDVTADYLDVLGVPLEKITASKRIYENLWPTEWNEQVATYAGLIVASAAIVFLLDWLAGGKRSSAPDRVTSED